MLFALLLLAAPLDAPPSRGQLVTDVFAPDVLARLEARGFSLAALLGAPDAASNASLFAHPTSRAWRDVATVLIDDLTRFEAAITGTRDDGHQFVIRRLAKNSAEAYRIESNGDAPRQIDHRWLRSPIGHFRLVAVVQRYDRRDFDPASPCGEVRFVYRLAYRTEQYRSSLPFFVNVVTRAAPGDCRAGLAAWVAPAGLGDAEATARWLAGGPLARPGELKQIEVNFQSLRFSAGYMTDFGGQALYIMRVFRPGKDGAFTPAPLENTPDLQAIARDPALVAELADFVSKNLARLDEGTLVLPDFGGRFLARMAVSYSTLGRARLANKPFRDLSLGQHGGALRDVLERLDLSSQRFMKTPAAVLERLDNLTCMGCHQSGGTAGFHVLGLGDDRVSDDYNQAELPFSPHFSAERPRRAHYLGEALAGRAPNRFRPHSFFPAARWSASGLPRFADSDVKGACLIDGKHFGAPLGCGASPNVGCSKVVTNELVDVTFGDCVVYRRGDDAKLFSGSVCRKGAVVNRRPSKTTTLPISTFDFLDTFRETEQVYPGLDDEISKDAQSCRPTAIGVPLGRTFRRCTEAEVRLDDVAALMTQKEPELPAHLCAAVGGSKFEECAQGNDVLGCLRGAVTRGMVDTCHPGRFCREDYICQRLPAALPGVKDAARLRWLHERNVGFCTPTYFLFNMRADGHPDPESGAAEKLSAGQRAKEYRGAWRKR